ncbi:hypothetical protein GCM10023151_07080 [Kangiella marina]|uniref:Sel1 repeat family protein n=2 Tax=Kangiella marina TaxID=1079178 RepID=A0ABP8IFC0_9GAMM
MLSACGEDDQHANLCHTHFKTGNYQVAMKHCKVAADNDHGESQYYLGKMFLESGKAEAGHQWIERSAAEGYKKAVFHQTVGALLSKEVDERSAGKAVKKMQTFAEAGDDVAQYWMGNVFLFGYAGQKNSPNEAAYWYQLAVDQGNHRAMNNLAWIKALARDSDLFDPEGAIELAKKVTAKYPKSHGYLDTLAAAYAAQGDFGKAVETQERVLALAEPSQCEHCSEHLLEYYQEHLNLYRQKKSLEEDLVK